jgi:hypothetical protein
VIFRTVDHQASQCHFEIMYSIKGLASAGTVSSCVDGRSVLIVRQISRGAPWVKASSMASNVHVIQCEANVLHLRHLSNAPGPVCGIRQQHST